MSGEISSRRRKRGAIRGSITQLQTKIIELQSNPGRPDTPFHAQRIADKIKDLDNDFKTHHLSIIELVDNEEVLAEEQTISDDHDDIIAEMAVERLLSSSESSPSEAHSIAEKATVNRRLMHLQRLVETVAERIAEIEDPADTDICLLEQLEGDVVQRKQELSAISRELFALDVEESDTLVELQLRLETRLSEASLHTRRLLHTKREADASLRTSRPRPGEKLPKIDVPKFNGDLLQWRTFWEQFSIAVHEQESISDSEKLVYLRHSLNDGTAKSLIEGLSRSGECYQEAIECLKSRYNRPRLTHQTHVRKIVDCPPLKDGNGKELRRLHDIVRQHLRALKAMDCDPSNPFVTSIIKLKLDPNTMFEWQKYSQEQLDVPHYQTILDFIDLRVQASESFVTESRKKHGREELKHIQRPITSYATSARFTNTSSCPPCLLCNPDRHPLYACAKFKVLNHTEKTIVVKSNNLCLNCLKPGHSSRSCRSLYHCKTCNKSHHSLLHINDFKPNPEGVTPSEPSASSVTSNAALGLDKNLLLMTCRLIVESPEGMSVEIRGVLDSASFISERLAQVLKLNRSSYGAQISGIGGMLYPSSKQSTATFVITPTHCPERRMNVTAIIVPKVTCDLPTSPVPCN